MPANHCKPHTDAAKAKRTPWLPGHIAPARPGVYERMYPNGAIRFCYYGSFGWCFGCSSAEEADNLEFVPSAQYQLPWRGLTEKPA